MAKLSKCISILLECSLICFIECFPYEFILLHITFSYGTYTRKCPIFNCVWILQFKDIPFVLFEKASPSNIRPKRLMFLYLLLFLLHFHLRLHTNVYPPATYAVHVLTFVFDICSYKKFFIFLMAVKKESRPKGTLLNTWIILKYSGLFDYSYSCNQPIHSIAYWLT